MTTATRTARTAAATLFDGNGRPVKLGRELGRGGEGTVFEVGHDADAVAKVYHNALDADQAVKLQGMPLLAAPDLLAMTAWPVSLLSDRPGGRPCGFLMPKVSGHRELHQLYGPSQRRTYFPKVDWSFLVHAARNCAAAVETVHAHGHVIGDINERGFLVSPQGTVKLIDCDTFQVSHSGRLFPCVVGVPHFTPPELQKADFRAVGRLPEHDSFGLGVLVFHLLFMGRHPFAGRFLGRGDMPIERAISEGRFAFSRSASSYDMGAPPHALSLESVSPELGQMFERAFARGASRRPAAADWRSALESLARSLATCAVEPSHKFPRHLAECPWCRIEQEGGAAFFTSRSVGLEFDPGFDLLLVWRQITAAPPVPDAGDFPMPAPPRNPSGRAVPEGAQFWRLGGLQSVCAPPKLEWEKLPDLPVYQPQFDINWRGHEEPEPCLPDFEPDAVADDPPLTLLDEPKLPDRPRLDEAAAAKHRFRQATAYGDYRTAKWGTLTSVALSVALCFIFLPAALGGGLMALIFGVTWFILWLPLHRRYLTERSEAVRRDARVAAAYEAALRHAQAERDRVRDENQRRHEAWARHVERLARAREELPARNAEKLRLWQEQRSRLESTLAAVRQRNAERRREWEERVREHEAGRIAEWKEQKRRVEEVRQQVGRRNAEARTAWEAAMRHHDAIRTDVERHNTAVHEARRRFDCERERRQQRVALLQRQIEDVLLRWRGEAARHHTEWQTVLDDLTRAKSEYLSLKSQFEQGRDSLCAGSRQNQLDEYLRQLLIDDAARGGLLPGIKRGRTATLLAYGIETAYDVSTFNLDRVQGFGPALRGVLLEWRRSVGADFKFDHARVVIPPGLHALHARVHPVRVALQQKLRGGPERLRAIAKRAGDRRAALRSEASQLIGAQAQANADLAEMDTRSK